MLLAVTGETRYGSLPTALLKPKGDSIAVLGVNWDIGGSRTRGDIILFQEVSPMMEM